jgi:putative ABC transport system permease protein
MSLLTRIRGTIRSLFRKQKLDSDLDEELNSYLDLLTEEKVRAGMNPEQARRAARLELGGIEQVKERVRDRRLGASIDRLAQDVRYGIRSLWNNVGLTVVAVLILAIGIGANTTLFSTVSAALIGGLPYRDSSQLVAGVKTYDGGWAGPVSRVDYFDYREQSKSFEDLALIGTNSAQLTVTGGGDSELIEVTPVTWNLFQTLGVSPVLGRGFLPEEEAAGNAPVTVISHSLWQRRFGGLPDVLGTVMTVEGFPATIVGVMPADFEFLLGVDAWQLIDVDGPWDQVRDSHSHWVVGKLKPGVTLVQAQSELDSISAGLQELYPETNDGKGLLIMSLQDFMTIGVRTSLLVLMGTTALVLLIACANVAGLLLARGQRRMSEMALRSALGASRWRLVRQLLTESVILTFTAGLLGVWLAFMMRDLIRQLMPAGDLGLRPSGIDLGVLLFALSISIATGLVVGLVPALIGTSHEPSRHLRPGTQSSEGVRGMRLRGGLVVLQVAVSVILLIGAGLLLQSLVQLATADVGFEAENLFSAGVRIQSAKYPSPGQRQAFFTSLVEEIETLPGVTAASLISKPPILGQWTDWPIWREEDGRPLPEDQFLPMARWVTPGYFETAGIPLLRGRDISDRDTAGAPQVVVVSELTARTLFPDEDPLGRMVGVGWEDAGYEIVGIVGDARINTVARGLEPALYLAAAQLGATRMSLMVRSDGDPALLVSSIREILKQQDPDVVLAYPVTMTAVLDDSLGGFRIIMLSLGGLAGVALLLTVIGLYGILAYNVSQRRREIGIRLAIGASQFKLIWMVVRRGMLLVGLGLLLGVAGAIPGTLLVRSFLFETDTLEPSVYAAAVVGFGVVAAAACLLPAWRTTQVDVVEVLKGE